MTVKMTSTHEPCGEDFTIEHDDVEVVLEAHAWWEAEHRLVCPVNPEGRGRLIPVPPDEQVLEVTRELPDGSLVRSRYVPAPVTERGPNQ